MHSDHPLWVGRWWFPYLAFSWIYLVAGGALAMFPRYIPSARIIRKQAIANGELNDTEERLEKETGLKGFIKATLNLLKNKTLVFACLAMSARLLVSSGVGPFYSKLTVIKFGAKQSGSNFYIGILVICGTTSKSQISSNCKIKI